MNNDKLRRKLIWKYFWKRKREEVWGFIKAYWPVSLIILWIISLIIVMYCPEDSITYIIGGCVAVAPVILLYIGGIGFAIYLFFREIIKWLRQNWEWATEDADRELKKRRKR